MYRAEITAGLVPAYVNNKENWSSFDGNTRAHRKQEERSREFTGKGMERQAYVQRHERPSRPAGRTREQSRLS